jgi:polysaccharide deacetylase family protein (PEP-CTERM system associated)
VNALTVDLEDYFHAAALRSAFPRASWNDCDSRVERNTARLLDMFAAAGVTATFFTLGCVARQSPDLIRRIASEGHEIASHGFAHYRVSEQSPREFAEDVRATKRILEDISGQEVIGYRAANFSVDRNTWWAFDVLAQEGYVYSSSVNPVRHDHYGVPGAPRFPFLAGESGILEIPVTTVVWLGCRVPAGGGGYFRLLPYPLYRRALQRVNRVENLPGNFYFHPWEIDPGQPRGAVSGTSRFRHYVNLTTMEEKVRRLLAEFRWSRMDVVYGSQISDRLDPDRKGSATQQGQLVEWLGE